MLHDLIYAIREGWRAWKFARHMRRGGNPDVIPF